MENRALRFSFFLGNRTRMGTTMSVHGHALGQSCATYMRDSLSLTHSNCFNLGNQCVGNVCKLVGPLLGKKSRWVGPKNRVRNPSGPKSGRADRGLPCARCDGGAQVVSEGASSKKVTRKRFDQHAWPRLRAFFKTHAETSKNVGKNYVGRTPFWGPKTGAANPFLLMRAPTLEAKFWTPKWGPAG